MNNLQYFSKKNKVSNLRKKKHFSLVRGLGVFALLGIAFSSFEVELRASEPTWTQETDVLLQENVLQEANHVSSSGMGMYPCMC